MLYPNKIKKNSQKKINYRHRGMNLENMLNDTNSYYIEKDTAIIHKKPTPTQATKVSYKNGSKIIEKGYFKEKSTLDYNGIYKGKYLDFEAKETTNKTSFPLSNIHLHQIKHIESIIRHKGISFLIISIRNKVFLLKGEDFLDYLKTHERKSITYDYIEEKGFIVKEAFRPQLDYLNAVDEAYFRRKEE